MNQQLVLTKLTGYARHYWNRSLSQLTQEQRIIAAFVLTNHFAFPQKHLPALFARSRITLWKDLDAAQLYYRTSPRFRQDVARLKDYITYYARFTKS